MPNLLRHATPFIAIVLLQAFLAGASLTMLSSVRAYVAGEGLWSKGQKEAVRFITLYASTGDEGYYRQFESALAVPLADRAARLAMEQPLPDLAAAQAGFIGGENHPDDVPNMIRLFRYFHDVSFMAAAVRDWRATDPYLGQLKAIGEALHDQIADVRGSLAKIDNFGQQIDLVNRQLAEQATSFSRSLGAASRAITALLTAANLLVAAALIGLIVWHIRNVLKQRSVYENALKDEKERAQVTLASIGEAVISTDVHGLIDYMNPEAERLIGRTMADAKNAPLGALFDIVDEATGKPDRGLIERMSLEPIRKHRTLLARPGSRPVPVSIQSAPLHASAGTAGSVLVLHDMTGEQELMDRLAWQASHDTLTGLPNRRDFEARLQRASETGEPGDAHGLMMLDLDQFKVVNDTCGHAAGDELLRQTSARLLDELGDAGFLARLGGDEFGVLIENCDAGQSEQIAERLLRAVRTSKFVWHGRVFSISVSIGVALMPQGATIEETLSAADVACYTAKERGRNRVQLHRPSDQELSQRIGEMDWVQRIGTALDEGRFCLYAQEIRSLAGNRADTHVELLLRLRDERGNVVPPGSFMPAAERFGLMPQIDRWVVRNAFALCARHLKIPRARPISSYAINLSGKSLDDDDFTAYVRQQLEAQKIPPQMICFEITETSAIANLGAARRFIQSLKELGCRFSLDDFGTGMSSVSYLKHLPVDCIKIDGSFVREILNSEVDHAMVEMITRLGKTLGKTVIAEFAETDAIVEALREIGVDYAQGYAIGKPAPLAEDTEMSADGAAELAVA